MSYYEIGTLELFSIVCLIQYGMTKQHYPLLEEHMNH